MYTCKGKCVFGGWAIGKIRVFNKGERKVKRISVKDPDKEMERFNKAKAEAAFQLKKLYDQVLKEVGKANAAIFKVHLLLLEDSLYLSSIEKIIKELNYNAEYAIEETTEKIVIMFSSIDNAYLRSRTADIRDVSTRIINILSGEEEFTIDSEEPIILFADDLSPSETVQLDRERCKIAAFVTAQGAAFSHTAILARTMNIPLIIKADIELNTEFNNKNAVVNGSEGLVYIDPNTEFITEIQNIISTEAKARESLNVLRGLPNVTIDGAKVELNANICHAKDVVTVIRNDAGGVGMYRSEFLFLEKEDFPDEEMQFDQYKAIAEILGKNMKCIIRTLDIGADKQLPYLPLPKEDNPAMGVRSIRISLRYPEVFRTQLRAIHRASAYGRVGILFPMITSVEELRKVKAFSAKVRDEVIKDGCSVGEVTYGIMIETPAAVVISDLLASEVEFFNIGTNDLAQYAMAADRQNPELDEYFDPYNTALMRMIKMTTDNAKKKGVHVSICGELASNTALTDLFLAIGVDSLSVPPSLILPLRKLIRETNLSKVRDEALKILG
ncbi:MAG: phosphoenolpyruvate--protein phosphotransferase [Oscillospiraceae bacterium]|nr:phosphoenolpyruvate--protein phosphotransferase [Oscillospiraceae bacterium]